MHCDLVFKETVQDTLKENQHFQTETTEHCTVFRTPTTRALIVQLPTADLTRDQTWMLPAHPHGLRFSPRLWHAQTFCQGQDVRSHYYSNHVIGNTPVQSTSLPRLFSISVFGGGIFITWTGPHIDNIFMSCIHLFAWSNIASQHTCLYEVFFMFTLAPSTTPKSSHQWGYHSFFGTVKH